MASTSTDFSAPPEEVAFAGFLFDMDGTIIDSTDAVIKHWHTVGKELNIDPSIILATSHGRRSIDVLKIHHPEKANWEYVAQMEGQLPKLYSDSAVPIPGSHDLLTSLPPHTPWTIVTSGTIPLVTGWLSILHLPVPEHLVTAESVQNGKPDPACYRLGLEKLGLQAHAKDVLVLEDSPAGIRAGKDAGCRVLAVTTTHTASEVRSAGADWVVKDLESVKVVGQGQGREIRIEIRAALRA